MNICIVIHERFGPMKGGVESVCYNLALEFLKMPGYQVFQLYAHDKGTPETHGVIAERLPSVHDDDAVRKIHEFLEQNKIDIIWNHSPNMELMPILKKSVNGLHTKIVAIYHNSPYARMAELRDRLSLAFYNWIRHGKLGTCIWTLMKMPLSWYKAHHTNKKFMKCMATNCDCVCMLSDFYCDEYQNIINDYSYPVRSVTNPLLKAIIGEKEASQKNQILIVSRHVWKHKRLDRMFRIWKQVAPLFPEWKLVVLGDGPDHDAYVELANRLKLIQISFEGMVDATPYYRESKIICMTSSFEGLPMVLIEAQQYGCVPIAYESFSALPDIIENGKTGYRIPPFKQSKFVNQLILMMENEDLLSQMSQNCKLHAREFDVCKIIPRWISIFNELLGIKS